MQTHASAGKRPTRTLVTVLCVVCGIGALGLSLMTHMDVSLFGFPDGHVTDYQKAADTPLTIAAWLETGLGLLFLAIGFLPISTAARAIGWLAALIGFVLVALGALIGVPWYYGVHLGLDNGIGG